jgi:hypothetical protein
LDLKVACLQLQPLCSRSAIIMQACKHALTAPLTGVGSCKLLVGKLDARLERFDGLETVVVAQQLFTTVEGGQSLLTCVLPYLVVASGHAKQKLFSLGILLNLQPLAHFQAKFFSCLQILTTAVEHVDNSSPYGRPTSTLNWRMLSSNLSSCCRMLVISSLKLGLMRYWWLSTCSRSTVLRMSSWYLSKSYPHNTC